METVRTATGLTEPTETGPTATARTEPTGTGRTAEPSGLAGLIGAAEAASLREQALGRAAFRSRIAPERAAALFDWPRLNAALAEHRLTPPRLRVEHAGADITRAVFRSRRTRRGDVLQDLDPSALVERLRDGATLIVDAVNELSPALQRVCAGLSAEFAASCQANLYACWGVSQGFDVHWDDHDVLVVQVEGCKAWSLYGVTQTWPTRRGPASDAPRPQTPIEQITLGPGDVLYLPRGYWHAAVGLGGPTLHLTIGLTRKIGADLLHWLADDLLGETIARADLPFEAGDQALGAHVARLMAELASRDPQALARAYRRHVESTLMQRPELSFPYIGEAAMALPADAVVTLASGAARLEHGPAGLVFSWRGVEFTLSPALEAPLRRLLAGERTTCADFLQAAERAGPGAAQAFLREMARRSAFVIGLRATP